MGRMCKSSHVASISMQKPRCKQLRCECVQAATLRICARSDVTKVRDILALQCSYGWWARLDSVHCHVFKVSVAVQVGGTLRPVPFGLAALFKIWDADASGLPPLVSL